MRFRASYIVGVTRMCLVALVLMVIGFAGAVHDAQGEIKALGKPSEDMQKGDRPPWKVDAQKLSYDQKNGVYEAEGEVHIHSGERSLRAQWAKFDTRKREAELRGGVFIHFGQDWLKGEYALWNVDLDTGNLEHGLVFFAKNNFHIQGKHLAKVSESQYEIEDGVITSCDPGRPDWSIRFKSMKVDSEGLGVARNTSFWVGSTPTTFAPILVFPANRDRQSGFLMPAAGSSSLSGIGVEIPFFWAIRPDMDATFYAQYLEKRGFMGGLEYRIAHPTWGEGFWQFHYLSDQIGKDELLENGYTYEGQDRWWLRSRHNFKLPYEIEGRLDLDLVSDRNYLNEFTMGSTSWDRTNRVFREFFGRGLINDKTITTRESILYLNHRGENTNVGLDLHYWDNLEDGKNQVTLKQVPRLFFDVIPTPMDQLPLVYSLNSSVVNYWREDLSRGGRLDLHPRVAYPLHWGPYLNLEPSVGVRALAYGVDWQDDSAGDGQGDYQGRMLPDARLELSSSINRVYEVDWGGYKAIQHVIRPEVTYQYVSDFGREDVPEWDSKDSYRELHDVRYGFSTYLLSKKVSTDQKGEERATYSEGARLRVSQAYNLNENYLSDPIYLRFDSLLSDIAPQPTYRSTKDDFSDISFELDFRPIRYVTLVYDSFLSPYDGSETGRDLMLTLNSTVGHTLTIDYRTREDSDINEIIGAVRLKLLPSVVLTTAYDYSFSKELVVSQAYGITYTHGCWGLTLAYRDDGIDQQVYVMFNLLGLGNLGAGLSPETGGMTFVQRPF
jgi:LPS-assembly protein